MTSVKPPATGYWALISKGWELAFLIRAFGLSEKLSIGVGFGFCDKGLIYQGLELTMKKTCFFSNNVS